MILNFHEHECCWKAWRKLAIAAQELAESYRETSQYHWVQWAKQLEKECREHENTELRYMSGDQNPLDLSLER